MLDTKLYAEKWRSNMLKWHKEQTEKWQKKFNVDAYALAWIAYFKGLIMGLLIMSFFI